MKLSDLQPDKRNARKRDRRANTTLEHSLRELGAGRSILIDCNGQVIAGNGVIESAAKAGITEVEVIPSDGTRIIAVQRTDLDLETDPQARELAIADNRTAELAEWNPETLAELSQDLDLQPYFTANELRELTGLSDGEANDVTAEYEGMPEYTSEDQTGVRQLIVHFKTLDAVHNFAQLIGQSINEKTKFVWYPKEENADLAGKKYE